MLTIRISRLDKSDVNSRMTINLKRDYTNDTQKYVRDIALILKITNKLMATYQGILIGLSSLNEYNQDVRIIYDDPAFDIDSLTSKNDNELYLEEIKRRIVDLSRRQNSVTYQSQKFKFDDAKINKVSSILSMGVDYHDTGTMLV